jgi:uncharacterized protein
MSEENADLARRAYAAFNTGGIAAIIEFLDPNIEWSEGMDVPEPRVYRGHDGVRRQQEQFAQAWESLRLEPERFVDAGDRLVVIVRLVGRGKGSGVEVEHRAAHVWTVREGKATKLQMYMNPKEALEAMGLRE